MPSKRISVGFPVWSQMMRARAYRALRMQAWFPHVPLALLVALTGVAQLILTSGSVQRLIAGTLRGTALVTNVASGLHIPRIRGVPQEAIGALLIIMGIGMLWRSRLAWVLTFLLTLATVFLELTPLSSASRSLIVFSVLLLVLLVLFRRSFTRASLATGTLFALTGVLFAVGYGVLGSYVLGAGFKPPIRDVVQAIYFAVVTMSTVGYGDVTPQTAETRLFTVSVIVLGLAVFATSLTAVIGPVIDSRMKRLLQPKRKKMKRTSHIIVTGSGPLARSALKALTARGLHATAIWLARRPEDTDAPEDLVLGDGSDTDVLHGANIEQARAVLALSEDDSFNAFVVLAAKEMNPNIRTVVAVSNSGNAQRLSRVHPDVVLTLPQLGGELLAMALSGEEVRADALVNQLLKLG
jgi:voltage-gated potassium channel